MRVPCSCNCNNSSIGKDHGAMALVSSWLERCEEVAKEMDVFSGVPVVVQQFEVALLSAEAPLHELSRRGLCFMCLIQWSQTKSCGTSAKRFQHTPTAPPQLRKVVDAALHISYAR